MDRDKENLPPPEKRQVPKDLSKLFPSLLSSCVLDKECSELAQNEERKMSDKSLLLDVPDWSEEDLNALEEIEKHVSVTRSTLDDISNNPSLVLQNQVANVPRKETCQNIDSSPQVVATIKPDSTNLVRDTLAMKRNSVSNDKSCTAVDTFPKEMLCWKLEAAESLLERLHSRLLKSTDYEEVVKLRKEVEVVMAKKNEIVAQMTESSLVKESVVGNKGVTMDCSNSVVEIRPQKNQTNVTVARVVENSNVRANNSYCGTTEETTTFTHHHSSPSSGNSARQHICNSVDSNTLTVGDDTNLEWMREFSWTYQLKKDNFVYFGNISFRCNQLEAMNAILSNRDVFVLMPTGGGKSLCYQLPALWGPGVTIVVSPLISLITDQVSQLHERGIFAAALTASTTAQVRKNILDDLRATFPRLRLLYVTPERISKSQMFHKVLNQLYHRNLLARFVIDEAHCVSQWGHDFRPDYTQLRLLKREFHGIPIMALTATATVEVREDIKVQLGIPNCVTFQQSFNRSNLTYSVREKKKNAMKEIAEEILGKYAGQCGIIYCLSQRDCEMLADTLYREYGILAAPYHAGLNDERRQWTHEDWIADKVHVICATVAFGMGINKGNVRYVYHYSMPKNIEGYYQESGRAGRDGQRSDCILYFSHTDRFRLLRMVSDSESNREQALRNEQGVAKMASYCLNDVECRRQLLLAYFNESFDPAECDPPCDNCMHTEPAIEMDFTHHALGLVEACESIQEEKGPTAQYLIKFYRGISGLKTGHSSLPSFGQGGKEMKEATCHRLIEDLISCQILRVYTEIGPYGQVMAFLRVNKMSSHYMNLRRGQCRFCLKTRSKSGWAKTNEDNLANKTSNRMEREDPIPSVESKSNNNQSSEVLKPLVDYLLQSRKQWLQKQPNNDNIPLTYVLTSEEAYEIAKQCPSDTTTLRNCLSRKFALDRFADDILHALTLYKQKKKRKNPTSSFSKGKQRKNVAVKT